MEIGASSTSEDVAALISTAYTAGGHRLGWAYIFGPMESRLQPKLVTIGLNPGGGRTADGGWAEDAHAHQDEADPTVRNSYFDQPWGKDGAYTPLQRQIQLWATRNYSHVLPEEILSFQFVPFRSPSWTEMPKSSIAAAIELGKSLLGWTLGDLGYPEAVVCFGLKNIREPIVEWFEAELVENVSVGWGNVSAQLYRSPKTARLIFLPHLSRFGIFGRPAFVNESRLFNGSLGQ